MEYIGSKKRLYPFIYDTIIDVIGDDSHLDNMVFCDLFSGTGIVSSRLKPFVKQIIANDLEYYSYVMLRNLIGNNTVILNKEQYIEQLNNVKPIKGFVYNNYCIGGGTGRQYFSDENGMKIDAVRLKLREWYKENKLSEDLYFFLLASIIDSVDAVKNTSVIYSAYLKHLKESARKEFIVKPCEYELSNNTNHLVFNKDANDLIKEISGDILYLDPPYNNRQYGSNYHILNTIALYDEFTPKHMTGLRPYNKSKYCSVRTVKDTFKELIDSANFKYIFLSYNNEGLLSIDDIKSIMSEYGSYFVFEKEYQRFKSDKDDNRNYKNNKTTEYLHVLIKS